MLFFLLGFICFVVATFAETAISTRVTWLRLVPLGLAFWVFVYLVTAWKAV